MSERHPTIGGFCLVFGIGMLLWVFWSRFVAEAVYNRKQEPAICADGRLLSENSTDARLATDAWNYSSNRIRLRCIVPIAVYPCADKQANDRGSCKAAANPRSAWASKVIDSGLRCVNQGASCAGCPPSCNSQSWNCLSQLCDGYQKARWNCLSRLEQANYFCQHVPSDEKLGIVKGRESFPGLWLVGGVLMTLMAMGAWLICVGMICFSVSEDPWSMMMQAAAVMFIALGALGIICGILHFLQGMEGKDREPEKKVPLVVYQDLAATMASGMPVGSNFTVVPVEQKSRSWQRVDVLLLSLFVGAFCCLTGTGSLWSWSFSRSKSLDSEYDPMTTLTEKESSTMFSSS